MTRENSRQARERLYHLLPAVYAERDHARGEPLRALLLLIQQEMDRLQADIEGLYDNWFVETAAEWLLPYIGDLLGVRNINKVDRAGIYSLRAYVANTLLYRQRKGTAAVLEQLAADVTNWEARVVEFFQLLGTTQYVKNHLRPQNLRTPNIRDSNRLELLDTPFDDTAHTAEVRRIDPRQGRYNIPNVGIFLWRLQPYFMQGTTPRPVANPPDGRYWLHPVGLDAPLFNRPRREPEMAHIARENNVPTPIRRRGMFADPDAYLAGAEPVLQVSVNGTLQAVQVCHLGQWEDPFGLPACPPNTICVAVDPELGRLAVQSNGEPIDEIEVSYTYGFSGDVGGGPYDRNGTLGDEWNAASPAVWLARVDQGGGPGTFTTLADAVAAWNAVPPGNRGIIAITDSHTYSESLTGSNSINVAAGSDLLLVAARPFEPAGEPKLDAAAVRPHLRGNLSVDGTAAPDDENPGTFTVNGLLIEGTVRVRQGNLGRLTIQHSTLAPGPNSLLAPSQSNQRLQITIERSICGNINVAQTVPTLTVRESVVDNPDGEDILAPGAAVVVDRSTILGGDDNPNAPTIRRLDASESIFSGRLVVERRQVGCLRFCHVPPDSRTPRRYRCQPDLALDGVAAAAARRAVINRLRPQFTSTTYGDPGYAQLSQRCAPEIRSGAEDGSEIGVFASLQQPQREANLRQALEEYLPFGLQAGIFYVT